MSMSINHDPNVENVPLLYSGVGGGIKEYGGEDDFHEISIECNILSYSVKPPRTISERISDLYYGEPAELHELLHGIYATFNPGELVCLMGSSGAGKTTLLNVLSGRAGGVLMGDIKYNGKMLPQSQMRLCMNYIPQDDILMSALTPREVLSFIAELRLDTTKMDRERRVNHLMQKLGISRCADVMVGDVLNKGISGGQRKRVSVGMELVNNPSILFVDEATTGLDSQTAEELVDILKEIARSGRTVICTIHQPSFEVFERFDRLLLLDSGRVVYNGPVKESSQYFGSLGHKCPEFINPIEYFMKVITLQQPVRPKLDEEGEKPALMTDLVHENKRVVPRPRTEWHKAWKDFSMGVSMRTSDLDLKKYHGVAEGQLERSHFDDDFFDDLDYPTSFWSQFSTLFRRCIWMTWKDPKQFRARVLLCTIVGLFGGLVYLNMGKTQDEAQNRLALMFQSIFFNGTNMLNNTVVLFPLERAVITREFRNGCYRMFAYYLSRVITAVMFQFVYVFVFVTISYFMSNLTETTEAYLAYLGALILLGSIAVSLGIVIGGLVPSVTMGPAVVSPLLIPLSVFSGFLVTPNAIPVWFIWLYYISFFQYTFHILVLTQFKVFEFECCKCDDSDSGGMGDPMPSISSYSGEISRYVEAAVGTTRRHVDKDENDSCPLGVGNKTGQDYIAYYYHGANNMSLSVSVAVLVGELLLFMVAGFMVMLWRGRQKVA